MKQDCKKCNGTGIEQDLALGLAVFGTSIPFTRPCWECHGSGEVESED